MEQYDSIKKINQMFEYIEKSISQGDDVEIDKLSKILCENKISTDRIFRFLTNLTIKEYVKKRKMSLACLDLLFNSMKVIDVAVKYGYSSTQAFGRVFYKCFGVHPSDVKENMEFKLFVPFVQIQELNSGDIKFKIENKTRFTLHTIKHFVGDREFVGTFARRWWKEVDQNKILGQRFGLSQWSEEGWFYHIASDKPFDESQPFEIDGAKWVVFIYDNPTHTIKQIIDKIQQFWHARFERDYSLPVVEKYLSDKTEIWYPIKEKK